MSSAHHPVYRKGVSALILNEKDEFLLVNLMSFEERYFAIPGGGVEENETLDTAVYREMDEELGIKIGSLNMIGVSNIPLRFTFKIPKINSEGKEYVGSDRYFFAFRFIGIDSEIQCAKNEIRNHKWVTFSELDKYLLFDNQLADTTEKIKELLPDIFT